MTMPTPEKTWQFIVNTPAGGSGTSLTDFRQLMVAIVKGLVEMPTNPWVVTGSSDASTAGMDSVNRWKPSGTWDITKLNWAAAGSAHSWIALKQVGIFSTCELCIDLSNAQHYIITITWCVDGLTGGTTLNRPTGTSITLINNVSWWAYASSTVFTAYVHVMQSTDGECTRVVGFNDDVPYLFWILDKPKNPVSGWTNPAVMACMSNTSSSVMTIAYLNDTARLNARIGTTSATCYMTGEGYGSNLVYENAQYQRPNQISGEITVFPIGIASETTGVKGRHGELYDIWWGPGGTATGIPCGTFPNDSTRKYWSPDTIILPWDGLVTTGSVPLTRY